MKKVFFIWVVALAVWAFLAVHFNAHAQNRQFINQQKKMVIALCNDIIKIIDEANKGTGLPNAIPMKVPSKRLYELIKEAVKHGEEDAKYGLLLSNLNKEKANLSGELMYRKYVAEPIK